MWAWLGWECGNGVLVRLRSVVVKEEGIFPGADEAKRITDLVYSLEEELLCVAADLCARARSHVVLDPFPSVPVFYQSYPFVSRLPSTNL